MPAARRGPMLILLGVLLALGAGSAWLLLRTHTPAAAPAREPQVPSEARAPVVPPTPSLPLAAPEVAREGASAPAPATPAPAQPPSATESPAANATGLRARMIDEHGTALPNATYLVFPTERDGSPAPRKRWRQGTSDERGRVELDSLAPGRWIAIFAPTYRAPKRFEVVLASGWNELGDIEFPSLAQTADLKVRLAGPGWSGDAAGVLHVRSSWGEDVDRWNTIGKTSWMRRLEPEESSFTFHGLPHGRYELTFFRSDMSSPARSLALEVPCEEVVIELEPRPNRLAVRLESPTSEPIGAGALLLVFGDGSRVGRVEIQDGRGVIEALPDDGDWSCIALAPGCAASEIDGASLPRGPDAGITIEMTAGHGLVVLARDDQRALEVPGVGYEIQLARDHAAPLAGVDVAVEGRTVTHTDARGVAIVDLPRADASIELGSATHVLLETSNLVELHCGDLLQPLEARFSRRW